MPRARRGALWAGLVVLYLSVASAFHSRFFYAHYFALLAPAIDPFFEDRLTALAEREYRLETVLLADPPGGLRFAPASRPGEAGPQPLYELWRRRGDGPG